MSMPTYEQVATKLREIEDELRRIGLWQAEPLSWVPLSSAKSFGAGEMTFEQWLQFVLIPTARKIIAEKGCFPATSRVAAQAFREFNGVPDTDGLQRLLHQFDDLFAEASDRLSKSRRKELKQAARRSFASRPQ